MVAQIRRAAKYPTLRCPGGQQHAAVHEIKCPEPDGDGVHRPVI